MNFEIKKKGLEFFSPRNLEYFILDKLILIGGNQFKMQGIKIKTKGINSL